MRTETVYVIGSGGHGKVVVDALLSSAFPAAAIVLTDDNPALAGVRVLGFPVAVPIVDADIAAKAFHVAIGQNGVRQRLFERIQAAGGHARSITHPEAVVSRFAVVGEGAFLAARSIVAPEATIGPGAILNHGCIVDHECRVGAFAHIAPNATLGGCVRVGDRVLVGAGANLLPGVSVGDDAVIGAGAVVTSDVAVGATVCGVPARSHGGTHIA
jgi:sugar O-acyltransferase (sialic acid O-acetyltransferase NeuD family)